MPFSKNRRFFTKYFPKQYVTINNYEKYYDYLLKVITDLRSKPILINIAKTSINNENRSYGFDQHIRFYNEVITKLANKYTCPLIDLYSYSIKNDILLSDGIHYNKYGSKIVAQKIYSIISNH